MSTARRFPFGQEPAPVRSPEPPPPSRKTEPLARFAAPAAVLPFCAPPPAPPATPAPPRAPARRRRRSRKWIALGLALLVFDVAFLVLVARGLR